MLSSAGSGLEYHHAEIARLTEAIAQSSSHSARARLYGVLVRFHAKKIRSLLSERTHC